MSSAASVIYAVSRPISLPAKSAKLKRSAIFSSNLLRLSSIAIKAGQPLAHLFAPSICTQAENSFAFSPFTANIFHG